MKRAVKEIDRDKIIEKHIEKMSNEQKESILYGWLNELDNDELLEYEKEIS